MNPRPAAAVLWFAALLAAQTPNVAGLRAIAGDHQVQTDDRCAALCALQDCGALDVPTVVAALGVPEAYASVAATAAAIVRHEWTVLPPELFAALDGARPAAAAALLRELAQAPRPAARDWVVKRLARAELPNDVRCLLLAARGEPLAAPEVDLLFAALASKEQGDGFHAAVGLVPPAVADALTGRIHALLAANDADVGRIAPLLERLSPDGWQRLLGLVVTLPPAVAEQLCLQLVQRDVPGFRERAAAALDGKIPLEPIWLLRATPLLDAPERRERLLAVLRDAKTPTPLQGRAFDALVEAGCIDPVLRHWALEVATDRPDRVRRLLDASVAALPEAWLAECLAAEPALATVTASALVRRPVLGDAIEKVATEIVLAAGGAQQQLAEALAMALAQNGSAAAIDRVWPRLREERQFTEIVDALARRRVPFAHAMLLAELAAPGPEGLAEADREAQLDAVRLALVALGDRRQLADLVAHARTRAPGFVRRCAHHARPLDARFGLVLLDAAAAVADDDLATELIGWAANADGPEVEARLLALWQAPEPSPRQEVALRALVAGASRARLVQELQAALREGPLAERHDQLAYEAIATMPAPLNEPDLTLLAELVLEQPLVDAAGEVARVKRWPDGGFGFPLVAAVAQRLRGADAKPAGEAFRRVAAGVLAHPRCSALSRQRLLVLWRSLEMVPEVQAAIGRATAPLFLSLPAAPVRANLGNAFGIGAGPAHWFAIDAAERAGDPAAAAGHARAAVKALLRLPSERRTARLFLGERDPAAGSDPWAALAAAPFVYDAEASRAAGDKAKAAAALALAREFAGCDAATLRHIEASTKEISR